MKKTFQSTITRISKKVKSMTKKEKAKKENESMKAIEALGVAFSILRNNGLMNAEEKEKVDKMLFLLVDRCESFYD